MLSGPQWQIFFVVFIFLLERYLSGSSQTPAETCVKLDGKLTCYATDTNPYRNYGSKTAYPAVYDDFTKSYNLKGCSPKVFYLLSRHATRYPDGEYIEYINKQLPSLKDRIITSYEKGKTNLCEKDIFKLKTWSPTMSAGDENRLSLTGAAEAEELGKRLRERFPNILGMQYSPERFVIEYTSRSRTKHTAENFSRGVFSEEDYEKINFKGKANDKLLQFHKDCKKIMKNCDNSQFDVKEIEGFTNGTMMQKALKSVSKRVGLNITSDDILHMYVACTFGHALNLRDAWCAVFSHDDMKVMEYAADLEDYYKRSYGNAVNYEQACPLIKYLVELFESYQKSKRNKVVLHFSHAGAITRFFAALGLFRDDRKLTADDFCALNNRKWRSSYVIPFNTNLVFILYDCEGDLKFIALHNEIPITIDGCEINKLCPLENFYNKYEFTAKNCDLNGICENACKIK